MPIPYCPQCCRRHLPHCPSPERIRELAAEIRETWDSREYYRRAGAPVPEHLALPHDHDMGVAGMTVPTARVSRPQD